MRRYSIDGQDTNTAATTILGVNSVSTTQAARLAIYDFLLGSDATPADNAAEYNLQRYTAAGTNTAVTPQALDPADAAALAAAGEAHSVEPTYTANAILLNVASNQRATIRWVAAPGGELICPATTANGVGVQSITIGGSAVNTVCTIHFEE